MAKKQESPEEKKEKWLKRLKYAIGICAGGFGILAVTMVIRNYKYNADMEKRLTSKRLEYYTDGFKNGKEVSDEFFQEMFLSNNKYVSVDTDMQEVVEEALNGIDSELSYDVSFFGDLQCTQVVVGLDFGEDLKSEVELISEMSNILWKESVMVNGEAYDMTGVRLQVISSNGEQVRVYWWDNKLYMDYFFQSVERENLWKQLSVSSDLSRCVVREYKDVELSTDVLNEEMQKYGTVIPYLTDELIKNYKKEKNVRYVLRGDSFIGYDYMSDSEKSKILDEALKEGKGVSETKYKQEVTKLSDLDVNTKKEVYLTPEEYIEYADSVDLEKDILNPNIQPAEEIIDGSVEEVAIPSWVCLFCEPTRYSDLNYTLKGLNTTEIGYQEMLNVYSYGAASDDLTFGFEELIAKFTNN